MNTYTIESFFENYKELIPSVIEKGRILRLGYNEENGTFTCQAAFDKLVPFDSTVEFEMKMRAQWKRPAKSAAVLTAQLSL